MQYEQMIEATRQRMPSAPPAALLSATVRALGEVVQDRKMREAQAQLPNELRALEPIHADPGRSVDGFCARLAELTESEPAAGRRLARTGLAVLTAALTAGQVEQLLAGLPHGYAQLFPDSAGFTTSLAVAAIHGLDPTDMPDPEMPDEGIPGRRVPKRPTRPTVESPPAGAASG